MLLILNTENSAIIIYAFGACVHVSEDVNTLDKMAGQLLKLLFNG